MTEPDILHTRILHGIGDACLPLGDIAEALGLGHREASRASAMLILLGLVERTDRGGFRLTARGRAVLDAGGPIESHDTGDAATPRRPERTTIRQRAWNAMRIARSFTVPDIVTAIAREGDGDLTARLRRYVSALTGAGYLTRARRRRPGTAPGSNGFPVYSLVRDTGPLAPVCGPRRRTPREIDGKRAR